jgi:hypothetical protein
LEWRAEPQWDLANRSTAEIATAGRLLVGKDKLGKPSTATYTLNQVNFRRQNVTSRIGYLLAVHEDVNPDLAKGLACLASPFSHSSLIIDNPLGTFFAPAKELAVRVLVKSFGGLP